MSSFPLYRYSIDIDKLRIYDKIDITFNIVLSYRIERMQADRKKRFTLRRGREREREREREKEREKDRVKQCERDLKEDKKPNGNGMESIRQWRVIAI